MQGGTDGVENQYKAYPDFDKSICIISGGFSGFYMGQGML